MAEGAMTDGVATQQQTAVATGNVADPASSAAQGPALNTEMNARYIEAVAKHEARSHQLTQTNKGLSGELEALKAEMDGLRSDPYAALEKLGGNMDEYTQRIINNNQPTTDGKIDELAKIVGVLKGQLEEQSKVDQQREEAGQQDVYYSNHAEEVKRLMAGPEYEAMRDHHALELELFGAEPSMSALVRTPYEQTLRTTGQHMKPTDTAAYLLTQSKGLVDKIKNSATIRKILGIAQQQQGQSPTPQQNQAQQRTLTNQLETTGGSAQPQGLDEMNTADFVRAAERLMGQQQQ